MVLMQIPKEASPAVVRRALCYRLLNESLEAECMRQNACVMLSEVFVPARRHSFRSPRAENDAKG